MYILIFSFGSVPEVVQYTTYILCKVPSHYKYTVPVPTTQLYSSLETGFEGWFKLYLF